MTLSHPTYGPTVLEHFRRPRNQGALESPDVVREGANPLCGDYVRIELSIGRPVADGLAVGGDGALAVTQVRFTANACAVSVAAASLLTERVRGLALADVDALTEGDLLAALGTELPTPRLRCALLPLVVLRDALAEWSGRRQGRPDGAAAPA